MLIIIVGVFIGACWMMRAKAPPTEPDYSYTYATVEDMRAVVTRFDQPNFAGEHAKARESSMDNGGYETIDGEEYSYVTNRNEADEAGPQTESNHHAYEVMDEDNTTSEDDMASSSDHSEQEDVDRPMCTEHEDMDGDRSDQVDGEDDGEPQITTQDEDYVSMKGEEATPHDDIQDTGAEQVATVMNGAYASNLAEMCKMTELEPAIEIAKNEAYGCTIATEIAETSRKEIETEVYSRDFPKAVGEATDDASKTTTEKGSDINPLK